MHRTQVEVPKLTEEQHRDAITVISADYWSLKEQVGSSAQVQPSRDSRSSQRSRSLGTGPQARPYQNRLKRETTKNVHFNKTGVYIATQVGETPPVPTSTRDMGTDTSDSEKGPREG